MTVADLLETLKITKQSLARVLKQLIDSGYIHQVAGPEDRRQRKLYPTQAGRNLALALAEPQSRRIEKAFGDASAGEREGVKRFLRGNAGQKQDRDRLNDDKTPISDDAAHLLVVDDDTRIRALLNRYLMEKGFRVTVAADGAEARRKLEGLDFDLIVMDVMMPGGNRHRSDRRPARTSRTSRSSC